MEKLLEFVLPPYQVNLEKSVKTSIKITCILLVDIPQSWSWSIPISPKIPGIRLPGIRFPASAKILLTEMRPSLFVNLSFF